jgi:hypothetical protein
MGHPDHPREAGDRVMTKWGAISKNAIYARTSRPPTTLRIGSEGRKVR